MKVIRNNVCFVEVDDLLRCPVPSTINTFIWINNCRFASFVDKDEIKYFQSRKDIVDYDEVAKLSDEELNRRINNVYLILRNATNQWLNANTLEKINKNIGLYQQIKEYTAVYECLSNYILNRGYFDDLVKELETSIESDKKEVKIISTVNDQDKKGKTYQKRYVNRLLKTLEK